MLTLDDTPSSPAPATLSPPARPTPSPPAPVAASNTRDGFRLAGKDTPDARRAENRGRLWLVLSYVLCPCHLPLTMGVVGAAAGGTALGAVLTANAWRFGALLTVVYAVVLWRGFHHLRRAKALAGKGRLVCGPTHCEVEPRTLPS